MIDKLPCLYDFSDCEDGGQGLLTAPVLIVLIEKINEIIDHINFKDDKERKNYE